MTATELEVGDALGIKREHSRSLVLYSPVSLTGGPAPTARRGSGSGVTLLPTRTLFQGL